MVYGRFYNTLSCKWLNFRKGKGLKAYLDKILIIKLVYE